MKALSKLTFVLAMTASLSSFANVRIKLVDKDDKPIASATVFAVVAGSKLMSRNSGGLPDASVRGQIFGGVNYVTNDNGVISSDPQKDLGGLGGGLFAKRTGLGYQIGLYSFGPSSMALSNVDGAKCVVLTGADEFTQDQKEELQFASIRLAWKVAAPVDVLCKFSAKSASEVLADLKELQDLAQRNGHQTPVAHQK